MISFGELRKKSVEWQIELSAVEKIYALDWLLKGIFDRPALSASLFLRGDSALANAYFPPAPPAPRDYPRATEIALGTKRDPSGLEQELTQSASDAAATSGLQFRLHQFQPTEARFEFTGPLGRRSAAQPLILVQLVSATPRSELKSLPLIHPFTDSCQSTLQTLSLEELTAERIVRFAQNPRARDIFDLWFILTSDAPLSPAQVKTLVTTLAVEKHLTLRADLNPQSAPILERSWDNALKDIRSRPSFSQAVADLQARLPLFV